MTKSPSVNFLSQMWKFVFSSLFEVFITFWFLHFMNCFNMCFCKFSCHKCDMKICLLLHFGGFHNFLVSSCHELFQYVFSMMVPSVNFLSQMWHENSFSPPFLGLYTFYSIFEVQKRFFKELFFLKFWPYVWLAFKSGF